MKKNDKKTSCFNDLFISCLKKVYERGAFFQQKVYERGAFSEKMVYKRVRGWTSGSPYKTFLSTPPGFVRGYIMTIHVRSSMFN